MQTIAHNAEPEASLTAERVRAMLLDSTSRERAEALAAQAEHDRRYHEGLAAGRAEAHRVLRAIKAKRLPHEEDPDPDRRDDRHAFVCPGCLREGRSNGRTLTGELHLTGELYLNTDYDDGTNPYFGMVELWCDHGHDVGAELGVITRLMLHEQYGMSDLAGVEEPPTWAIEPLVEVGQFASLYGPRAVGKSLLGLDYACRLALTGADVLYLDHENPHAEIRRRIRAMEHPPGQLTAHLRYLNFPPIHSLDTEAGAEKLAAVVEATTAELVILDTWSKFISGDEASPSTHTRAYNLAVVPLRRQGITVLALDHPGKDISRGPRGGSSKSDNVDVEWIVTAKAGGRLRLERTKSRTGRGVDLVELVRRQDPLRHDRAEQRPGDVLTPEVRACVAKLDELGVPAGWSRTRAAEALRANDYRVRIATLAAALKVRRERGTAEVASLDLFPDDGNSGNSPHEQDRNRPGTGDTDDQ
jgi:hypothetical protein